MPRRLAFAGIVLVVVGITAHEVFGWYVPTLVVFFVGAALSLSGVASGAFGNDREES